MAPRKQNKRIYLDYAATTPVDVRVLRVMEPYFKDVFGNPGSLHAFGQAAIAALDQSREKIATAIGAGFRELVFTSSATEANNLALRGILQESNIKNPQIIISSIEHESVLGVAEQLERNGVEVVRLPVDQEGVVDLATLRSSLNERTVLVSVMYANNEIGTIQLIPEIASIIKEFRAHSKSTGPYPVLHTDASQAFQFLNCNVDYLGIDFMTLSSHKIYGPKGAGALYIKNKKSNGQFSGISAVTFGGGQEFGLRSGTENIPAIVGFAKAVEIATAIRNKEAKRLAALRKKVWQGIKKIYKKSEINGPRLADASLPNMLNVYLPGILSEDFLTKCDLAGLAISSGSACRSRAMEPSLVIEALGFPKDRAKASIRLSLGRQTTAQEINAALRLIKRLDGRRR